MSAVRVSLFLLVLTSLLAGGHLYLYRRLLRDLTGSARVRRAGAVLLGLGAALILARLFVTAGRHLLPPPLPALAAFWTGLALYAVLWVAALGLLQRRPRAAAPASPERRRLLATAAVGGVGALGTSLYGTWRAFHPPEVTELAVKLPGLPRTLDGLRVVQLSDLHIGDLLQERFLRERVELANRLRPDLVALTGDLVDGSVAQLGPSVHALTRLESRFGTYFCTGNHEYYSGDVAWAEALQGLGIHVLRNARVAVGDGGGTFDLLGVDDWSQRNARHGRGFDLARAAAGRDPARGSVLLAHQPFSFPEAAERGIGLQLSGHTHGGQLFPFTLVAELVHPFCTGHFVRGGSHLYVNRGTGFWGPAMRVGSPPEVTVVTLVA